MRRRRWSKIAIASILFGVAWVAGSFAWPRLLRSDWWYLAASFAPPAVGFLLWLRRLLYVPPRRRPARE